MEEEKVLKKNGNVSSLLSDTQYAYKELKGAMSWKDWKQQKREEHKKWKEGKLEKKRKKQTESEEKCKEAQELNASAIEKSNRDPNFTVSIAVPGSILDNAQSPELKTYLAGQIARAAAVFNVNEIVVFSETSFENLEDERHLKLYKKNHGCMQLIKILQFLECPQYLRKYYFPIHKDLEYAGLLNPLDLPHHLRVDDVSTFREGTVINKPVKPGKGSYVYIGLRELAIIDKVLEENVRVTVKLDDVQTNKKHYKGTAVSPSTPYKYEKIYWGYNVRLANGLSKVFSDSPFKGGYDLTIGTSDKGQNVDSVKLPKFKHLLIVFGGLKGIEGCLEADESIEEREASNLFNFYLNTCPSQGSRTIRTEEAILISMAALRPGITRAQNLS